jgi:hypothetical protein
MIYENNAYVRKRMEEKDMETRREIAERLAERGLSGDVISDITGLGIYEAIEIVKDQIDKIEERMREETCENTENLRKEAEKELADKLIRENQKKGMFTTSYNVVPWIQLYCPNLSEEEIEEIEDEIISEDIDLTGFSPQMKEVVKSYVWKENIYSEKKAVINREGKEYVGYIQLAYNFSEKEFRDLAKQIANAKNDIDLDKIENMPPELREYINNQVMKKSVPAIIETFVEYGLSKEEIIQKLKNQFALSDVVAKAYYDNFWH